MAREHFLVVALDSNNGQEIEIAVRSFESKDLAVSYAETCIHHSRELFTDYGKIEAIPSDVGLFDGNLRSYRYWPNYKVKRVIVRDLRHSFKNYFF